MAATTKHGGLGWRPSVPDMRDLRFTPAPGATAALPPKIDLRSAMPPVYDQGNLGSCTANAIGAAVEHALIQSGRESFLPSRLAVYYDERVLEHAVKEDAGAEIRDGFKVLARKGAAPEALWPYDDGPARFKRKPPARYYAAANNHQAVVYKRVAQTDAEMKAALAGGFPIVVGFTVYESFESDAVAKAGVVPMPGMTEKVLGGHAVLVVGYDDQTVGPTWGPGRWLVRNSWGPDWGQAGYCTMPYAYLTNPQLAGDFWLLESVE